MMTKLEIGTWVRSEAVGSHEAFIGQIVDYRFHNYVVRDAEKRRWERHHTEITLVTPKGSS